MAGVRKYCLFRDSEDVKMVVNMRLKSINIAQMCRDLKIDRMNFEHWRTGKNPRGVSQYDLWRICLRLHIKVSIKMEFDDTV